MSIKPPVTSPPQTAGWVQLFSGDFFFLWSSQVFLNVAMVVRLLASAQWLYDTTGSAKELGILGAVQLIRLPLALVGGTLADRFDRKKLMIFTQFISFADLFALTVLAVAHLLQPWHIFLITAISGSMNVLGASARPAMLSRVVPKHLMARAVTLLNVTNQASQVGAPLLFAGVYATLHVTGGYTVAMILALASTIFPFLIRTSGKPDPLVKRASTLNSLKDGFTFVAKHPILPGLFLVDLGVTIVSFYRQLFPVFAKQLYGLDASGTGLLNTFNAVGSIAGTLLVFTADRVPRKGVLVLGATLVYTVFLVAFGLNRSFPVGLGIVMVLGMTDSVSQTMRLTIVQLTSPDALIGRVSAVRNFAAQASNNLGQIEVAMASAAIGAGNAMIMGGVLGFIFVLVTWRFAAGLRDYPYKPGQPVGSRSGGLTITRRG